MPPHEPTGGGQMVRRVWIAVWLGALVGCSSTTPEGGGRPLPAPPACSVGSCDDDPITCVPLTCAMALGQDGCGTLADGCGGQLDCGTCSGEATCGGGGTRNKCGIPPQQAGCTELRGQLAVEPVSGGILGLRECTADGWCTVNSHMGSWLNSLWGFSEQDVWAVGNIRTRASRCTGGARGGSACPCRRRSGSGPCGAPPRMTCGPWGSGARCCGGTAGRGSASRRRPPRT